MSSQHPQKGCLCFVSIENLFNKTAVPILFSLLQLSVPKNCQYIRHFFFPANLSALLKFHTRLSLATLHKTKCADFPIALYMVLRAMIDPSALFLQKFEQHNPFTFLKIYVFTAKNSSYTVVRDHENNQSGWVHL